MTPLVWWSEAENGVVIAHRYGGCYSLVQMVNSGVECDEELSSLPDDAVALTKSTPPEVQIPMDPEVRAMQAVQQALVGLSPPARARLMTWVLARYGEKSCPE